MFSVFERSIAHKRGQTLWGNALEVEVIDIEIYQVCLWCFGPLMPLGWQRGRVVNQRGEVVDPKLWNVSLQQEVRAFKRQLPIQWDLFQNLLALVALMGILYLMVPDLFK